MNFSKNLNQQRPNFQLAGLLYLIIAILGGFSIGYMPGVIVDYESASNTFQNLIANKSLFQVGIVGDIIVLILEVVLTVILYRLFKSYSSIGMTIATYSRLAMAIIMGMNLINYMIPGVIMNSPDFLSSFSAEQLESLSLLFFKAHKYGEMAWQVFFSIHLFTLGYVLYKSKQGPKVLGILMLIGGVGYAGDCFTQLTFIESEMTSIFFSTLLIMAVIAEFWFAFWLLIKGGKLPKIEAQTH